MVERIDWESLEFIITIHQQNGITQKYLIDNNSINEEEISKYDVITISYAKSKRYPQNIKRVINPEIKQLLL